MPPSQERALAFKNKGTDDLQSGEDRLAENYVQRLQRFWLALLEERTGSLPHARNMQVKFGLTFHGGNTEQAQLACGGELDGFSYLHAVFMKIFKGARVNDLFLDPREPGHPCEADWATIRVFRP